MDMQQGEMRFDTDRRTENKAKGEKKIKTVDYHTGLNDSDVNCFLETRFEVQTPESVKAYVAKMNADPNVVLQKIEYNETHIGNIKLEINPHHNRGELSFVIWDKKYWGRGIGTREVRKMVDFAGKFGLRMVTAGCYSNNWVSRRVLLKSGFKLDAVLPHRYICNGDLVDRICFSIEIKTHESHLDKNHL